MLDLVAKINVQVKLCGCAIIFIFLFAFALASKLDLVGRRLKLKSKFVGVKLIILSISRGPYNVH